MKRTILTVVLAAMAAAAQAATVTLDWDKNTEPDLAGYNLYYATSSMKTPVLLSTAQAAGMTGWIKKVPVLGAGTSTYTFPNNLGDGTSYYFRLTAVDVSGNESGFCVMNDNVTDLEVSTFTPAAAPPVAPGGVTATADSSSQITVRWTHSGVNESGFKILWSLASDFSNPQTINPVPGGSGARSYPHTSLPQNTPYYYRVIATGPGGDSPASSPDAPATTLVAATQVPLTPVNFATTSVTSTAITLSWAEDAATTASNKETNYSLERSITGPSSGFTVLQTVSAGTTGSYLDNNPALTAGNSYYYRVRAHNGIGDSAYTAVLTVRTMPIVIPVVVTAVTTGTVNAAGVAGTPVQVSITGSPSTVQLSYSPVGGTSMTNVNMTQVGTSGVWQAIIPSTVTGMAVGSLQYQVTANGVLQLTRTVQIEQKVTAAPDGTGSVALPHPLGGTYGMTRADFSRVPMSERPKLVGIEQRDPMQASPAVREAMINRTLNNGHAGMVFDFRADDKPAAVFTHPVKLTLAYRDVSPADGIIDGTNIPASSLKVFYFDGYEWRLVGGTVNTTNHTVTVDTQHFSQYALFPAAPAAAGAAAGLAAEHYMTPATLDGIEDTATFGLNAKEVHVYDVKGHEVFKAMGDGTSAIVWTGRNEQNVVVESGSYVVKVISDTGTAYQTIVVAK